MNEIELNPLSGVKWRAIINKAPTTSFLMQRVNIPAITLPPVGQPTPNVVIPYPGDTISFDHLYLEFIVDVNLTNYLEIFTWLTELGFPESSTQYQKIEQDQTSDISIMMLNGRNNANVEFIFRNAFPIYLGSLDLDNTIPDTDYVKCMTIFAYPFFNVEQRNSYDPIGLS